MTIPRRSGHRRAIGASLLTGALVLGGCGSGSSSTSSELPGQAAHHTSFNPTHRDFAQVRALLARRAHAVLHHDERGFLATVDDRSGALVKQQTTLFENMSQLSIASLSYVMDPSVELVAASVPGDDPAFRPEVFEFLQIGGTMQHPVSNALEETFVRNGDRWLLGAETTPSDNE